MPLPSFSEKEKNMGKFTGVLLASDFDNTLVYTAPARHSNAPVPNVSAGNQEALRYFMANGGRFAISTGRALPAFLKFADQVPMNAPGIICNGAALYDFEKGEYVDTVLMNEETRIRGQEVLDRFPTTALEAYHIDNVIHAVRPNIYTRQHEHVTHVAVTETPSLLEVPLPLGKIMFEENHELLEEVRAWMLTQPWAGEYEIFFSDTTLLEVTAKGASKGNMVRVLAKHLGISMDHVYCAGDEMNDISMLTVAAEGFAPENCIQAVRDCGVTVIRHCKDDAIAEIVEILDKRYH